MLIVYTKKRLLLLSCTGLLTVAEQASAVLIASEGFSGGYTAGQLASGANNAIVSGNSGFNATNVWTNGSSSGTYSASGLTHSGLSDEAGGTAVSQPTSSVGQRNVNRSLAATPALSSTYYLSGLVSYQDVNSLAIGAHTTIGFFSSDGGNYTNDSNYVGLHLGLQRTSDGYNLVSVSGATPGNSAPITNPTIQTILTGTLPSTTYQIVLKLDANATGLDTVTAWYATDGGNLTLGATYSVETFSSATDIARLSVQSTTTASGASQATTFLDEVRLGTELADVTTLPIPEPTTLAVSGLGLLLLGARRRRRSA